MHRNIVLEKNNKEGLVKLSIKKFSCDEDKQSARW